MHFFLLQKADFFLAQSASVIYCSFIVIFSFVLALLKKDTVIAAAEIFSSLRYYKRH